MSEGCSKKMNIDLVKSKDGQVGLISDTSFPNEINGVIFDRPNMTLSLEFAETFDSMELNIPVDHDFLPFLIQNDTIHIGVVEHNFVKTATQVPLRAIGINENDYIEATKTIQ